jgi:TM2 domain-containing membrane protein YozV
MALIKCSECGTSISDNANSCPSCGHTSGQYLNKSKIAAVLLAFFLGGLGLHKFYLGRNKAGILYLVFFWTFVPAILGLIDAIVLLVKDQREFSGTVSKGNSKEKPFYPSDRSVY